MLKLFSAVLFSLVFFLNLTAQDWKIFGSGAGFFFYMIDSTTYLVEDDGDLRKYTKGVSKVVYHNDSFLDGLNDIAYAGDGTF